MNSPTLDQREIMRVRPNNLSPIMRQSWDNLLFVHWEVNVQDLQKTLPSGLYVDTFEGKAYLGLVPFFMRKIRPNLFPSVPYISNFLECNVRTYVYDEEGNPGVWFHSLDTNRWLAYKIGRIAFSLPYFWAKMKARKNNNGEISYYLKRKFCDAQSVVLNYSSPKRGRKAERGTLDFFLLERYMLFSLRKFGDGLLSCRVHHQPYVFSESTKKDWPIDLFQWNEFEFEVGELAHVCTANRVDVEIYRPENKK